MRRDDETLVLLGLVVLVAMSETPIEWGSGWVWPVPPVTVNGVGYHPVVSDGWGTPRPGYASGHRGADVMYQRRAPADLATVYKPGTPDGTRAFFTPPRVPILAARDGKVWSVSKSPRGWSVVLDHGKPWSTFYQHLEFAALPEHRNGISVSGKPTPIRAGDVIGYMGADPLDAEKLRHLHFEAWHGGGEDSAVDVAAVMPTWPVVPWSVKFTT